MKKQFALGVLLCLTMLFVSPGPVAAAPEKMTVGAGQSRL